MNFNLGNVIKYVWRADLKNNAIEDLEKAMFYLQDEITKRQHQNRFLVSLADLKSTEKNND